MVFAQILINRIFGTYHTHTHSLYEVGNPREDIERLQLQRVAQTENCKEN
jgi:hypothetical protein